MMQRPTEIRRETILQEFRTVVKPDHECDREVQIFTPAGSVIFIGMDVSATHFGLDRVYKAPRLAANWVTRFPLMRGQHFCLATESGQAECSIILSELLPNIGASP